MAASTQISPLRQARTGLTGAGIGNVVKWRKLPSKARSANDVFWSGADFADTATRRHADLRLSPANIRSTYLENEAASSVTNQRCQIGKALISGQQRSQ